VILGPGMNHCLGRVAVGVAALMTWIGPLRGETIPIPNGSFESPTTVFVDLNIDSWQKSPKPDEYVESGGFLWTQLTGTFKNTPPGNFDHIDNCDGNQAIWLFAVPKAGLFQDYNSQDSNDAEPTHAFDPRFEVGKSYELTAGVIAMGGGMSNGATAEISLYYRDAASNMLTVAATTITNLPTIFSNRTHLLDFEVSVPTVQAADPWAGQNIGVQILSTVSTNLQGGYWGFDNVRLSSFQAPTLSGGVLANGQFTLTLQGEPGLRFEILASSDAAQPLSNWTSLGTVSNVTGTVSFTDVTANSSQRFYRAVQLP